VTFARDVRYGWGNVVIIRHVYQGRDRQIRVIDSLYGHLLDVNVREGQHVRKGDQIGTMGSNNGMYYAHLHFEIRKNLRLGMRRSDFKRDFSNYYDPTNFINLHRSLRVPRSKYRVAVDTYDHKTKYFPPKRGTGGRGSSRERLSSDEDLERGGSSSRGRSSTRRGTLFRRSDDYFY
jgi:murein DD-endopeptidase MepM/ murein hydrolase activator NlpD